MTLRKVEWRSVRGLELRAEGDGDDDRHIVGHAAVFNSLSEEIFGFREIIMPTAFDRALKEKHDVRALVEHLPLMLLGRTKSGTLALKTDKVGLLADISPPATAAGKDALTSIERGDIDGMSFAFVPKTTEWRLEDGVDIREVHDLDLVDVSVVAFPAYTETDVELNGLNVAQLEERGLFSVVEHRFRLAGRLAAESAVEAGLDAELAGKVADRVARVPLTVREREQRMVEIRATWPTRR